MLKYWLVFKISILDVLEYRFDFFMHTTKYAVTILLMGLVWTSIGKHTQLAMTNAELILYFSLGALLYSLSNFHTWYIEQDIKLGTLSKYLLKPLSPFFYYLSHEAGNAVIETFFKALIIVPFLFFFGAQLHFESSRLLVFILYLPMIFLFSFTLFSIISIMAFWLTEAYAVRWALTIMFRFLSGLLVPISFLPELAQQISRWLPFQHLAFSPIQFVQGALSYEQFFFAFLILVFWTAILTLTRLILWREGLRGYEGTGI